MSSKLNIILDIDETLVYFIKKCYYSHSWDKLGGAEQQKYKTIPNNSGIFLIRPHLETFMNWIFEHCNVYLWTWSDEEYAKGVADMITRGKREQQFKGILVDEDANASSHPHGNSKDLNYLWYPKSFCKADKVIENIHECNTIIIDDLPGNSVNTSNFKNSITVNPFGIFGEVKDRSGEYEDLSNDRTLLDVLEIIKKVHCYLQKNPPNNDTKYTNVFCPSNIQSIGLKEFVKKIITKDKTIVTAIGAGESIHFKKGNAQYGGKLYKTAKKDVKSGGNIYVGARGGKYIMNGGGKFVKLKGQGRVRVSE